MTSDCCLFKIPGRSVDWKHLMRFQSETSVLKFLWRSLDGAWEFLPLFFQFVPFRDFQTHGALAQDLLSKEVLAELPDQLLSFMTTRTIKPKPPRPITVDNIVPIIPQSTNQTAPFPSNPSTPYPANPSAPSYSANQNTPYSTNRGPPYPTN